MMRGIGLSCWNWLWYTCSNRLSDMSISASLRRQSSAAAPVSLPPSVVLYKTASNAIPFLFSNKNYDLSTAHIQEAQRVIGVAISIFGDPDTFSCLLCDEYGGDSANATPFPFENVISFIDDYRKNVVQKEIDTNQLKLTQSPLAWLRRWAS